MATLALAAVGSAIGGALLPSGLSVVGISGAALGGQLGRAAGAYIDQALFGASGRRRRVEGPRLRDLTVTGSTEGQAIPRVYGQVRLGGQIIWARDIEEVATTKTSGGSGKGGGGSGGPKVTRTDYSYFATFAVALCEGEISGVARIWADGQELDLTGVNWRLYNGTETQEPDTLIAAIEGATRAPAFRGTAYVVFERLPLTDFGNRIPQLAFETSRATDDLDRLIRGVVLIPAAGEYVYATEAVTRDGAAGSRIADNVHTRQAVTDLAASLDRLQAELPDASSVSMTVAWFGDDLRADRCSVAPRVDRAAKDTRPLTWRVAGVDRAGARLVSFADGRPAYGGTPSDETVIRAIRDMKTRGLRVTLTPFLLMDIAAGSTLPDPSGTGVQPAYPWRGRIAVPRTLEKTPGAADAIAAFVGAASPAHFATTGDAVTYSGPDEWSYRRFVLHHAALTLAAGGVDAFVIGSEMRGLTTARTVTGAYPFVAELVRLAADVKAMLGPATKVTYAADWSEYFGHQPADGSGDVSFHLDPLWASPAIDAVGIDLYWPLADWRDGDHLDRTAGVGSTYDVAYLKRNIAGGEGYDWYYASEDDRRRQLRTQITDGLGKPWVFRPKDLKNWWQNRHFDRAGGIESTMPTAWLPEMKPVWLMEIGCPAVDKGANQPNVFVDPKSAESRLPHFSSGRRDDLMQRRYLRALLEALTPGHSGAVPGLNPASSVYGGPMVPPDRIHVYCWDARPYPAFPADAATWGDAPNWRLGHWIAGRLARASLAETVGRMLADMGVATATVGDLVGTIPGYVIDRIMSPRAALEPLELAYFFDCVETGNAIRFQARGVGGAAVELSPGSLVETKPGADLLTLERLQEADLPSAAKLTFLAAETDYRQAVAEARRIARSTGRIAEAEVPLVLDHAQAGAIAETWLHETWAARERAKFTLPPSALAIEPGDVVSLETEAGPRLFRITETGDHGARDCEALSFDAAVYTAAEGVARESRSMTEVPVGQPDVIVMDLPIPSASGGPTVWIAASAVPWPGTLAIYRSAETSGFSLVGRCLAPATWGRTTVPLAGGPAWRRTAGQNLIVSLMAGSLQSVTPLALFGGANTAALEVDPGRWEIVQFERADLVASRTWRLRGLLRGQSGTEALVPATLAAGARFVLLDTAIARLDLALGEIGLSWRWRVGPANRDVGHPDYAAGEVTVAGAGLVPLSPVRLSAKRNATGDLGLSWIRRTRIDGDGWALADIPLGEDGERYRVMVRGPVGPKRVVETTGLQLLYSLADQQADWGGAAPAGTIVEVCQLSAVAGPGAAASLTL